jgi:Family of unknown function (DUF6159)
VETRAGWTGRLIIGFFGLGWGMSTYLVVPVLVMEEAGVMDSVRRSAALLRQTWGEQLISAWLSAGWDCCGRFRASCWACVLGANGYPIFIVPAIAWFATMMAAFTAAREIFTVALYRYATTGQAPRATTPQRWGRCGGEAAVVGVGIPRNLVRTTAEELLRHLTFSAS